MKNIFTTNNEKITEKAFSQSIIISVVSILLCIFMLCSLTYAWFTSETSSSSNTLMSGSFDVTINVSKVVDNEATASTIEAESNNDGEFSYTLEPGTHEISLRLTEGSTVKGHCIVTIGNAVAQHTAAIIGTNTANVENEDITDPFTFQITVTEDTTVTLEPRWGVVVVPDIRNGMTIVVNDTSTNVDENNQSVE